MATFKFEGVDDLIAQYNKLYKDTDVMIGRAIYKGAAVVMSSVVNAIESLTTDDHYGTSESPKTGPSTYQKGAMRQGIGIAKLRQDGDFWNVKIGFDGYTSMKTKAWPKGQPISMIARSVESGTSWMQKQPFMRRAENASRVKCEQAMAQEIDQEITKRVKES